MRKDIVISTMQWESGSVRANMWHIDLQTQTCLNRHAVFVRNVIQLCSLQINYMDHPLFSECKLDTCSRIVANKKKHSESICERERVCPFLMKSWKNKQLWSQAARTHSPIRLILAQPSATHTYTLYGQFPKCCRERKVFLIRMRNWVRYTVMDEEAIWR